MWTNVVHNKYEQYHCKLFVSVCNCIALDIFVPVFSPKGEALIQLGMSMLKGVSTDILESVGYQEYVNRLFRVDPLDQIGDMDG